MTPPQHQRPRRTRRPAALALTALLPLLAACAERGGDAPELGEPGASAPPSAPVDRLPWPDSALAALRAMEEEHYGVRDAVVELLQRPTADSVAVERALERQRASDRASGERLEALVRAHGWPARREVGREAASAAFLIAQHASHDVPFQKEYLAFLEREHAQGEAPGEAVALLTDLIRLAEGRPQLYGTQVDIVGMRLTLPPIEDEARVDERRAALGMGTLAEYVARIKQAYGIPD